MKRTITLLFLFLLCTTAFSQQPYDAELGKTFDHTLKPFYFGVASGDPMPDGVVIWTKILPASEGEKMVAWQIATDTLMQQAVQSGTVKTDYSSAFTVKVDVKNLLPGTTYFYRFQHENTYSPIGRTKTAPSGDVPSLRLAVASCANFPSGYFNAYGHIARRNDIDAVVFLGDYIYEYGNWQGGRKRMMRSLVRVHIPDHELHTLQDYRTRYGQYRLDKQLMECHRLHPFIVVWDDHEIANNTNMSGAGRSNGEGWEERKAIARQVYFEWLPIRDNLQHSIVRKFSFGNLAEMWMLDGRLEGRSPQASGLNDPALNSPDRHMLGEAQTNWLLNGMAASTARWKIMGNQVIFSPLNDSKVFSRRPEIGMDRWDGYPAERQRIFDFFYQNHLQNIIVITGDVHTSWAFELTGNPADPAIYDPKTGKGVIGAEFTAPSISSFNFDEVAPKFITWEAKRRFYKKKNNPHLRYLNLNRHGYFTLTLTPQRAEAEWVFMKTLKKEDARYKRKGRRYIGYDGNQIKKR